ncbi:MAG TPA: HAD family hydrolase [Actinophytocola sp.]|uniref:HAD family hydrolase n=1 Tax=Actinophytocola sp. TaxID=1872138 RepID=UPI002DB8B3E7|nr:HAD family hydrolase [Actinophytocola sp.]HEU5471766.1 HAD family hydrolase [Actinophytocola sp.]
MSIAMETGKPTSSHPLLEDIHRVIADRSCAVLSLDIFDTILWRRVPRPTDVFAILGSRLRAAGQCAPWVTDATFRRMRIAAEQAARERRGEAWGNEVSLFDIWGEMPPEPFGGAPIERLVEAEVELEREFTEVDLDIADVIQLARKNDVPVILVSDTYFTEEHLRHLLDRPELGPMQDVRVFRSHQHGLDKASGLFEIVLKELGRDPEQLVHIGDNEIADHEAPAELGIRTLWYERIDDRFGETLDREREEIEPFGPAAALLDPRAGDFGLTSLRAKTLLSGSNKPASATDTAWRYGATVLGPVLTGLAEWAARWAHETGTQVLWCPMREGELLSKLVNDAARTRGWKVTAKPIWLSRHVVSIAALDAFDTDSVTDFIRRSYQPTVRQLLGMLHLRSGDVPVLAGELDTVLDNGPVVERVAIALTEAPHIRNQLAARVTAMRDRLIRMLQGTGALDAPEMTLVDLGWGGTIQYYLARVLKLAEAGVTVNGLYLATDHRSTRVYRAGLRAEGFLAQAGHPQEVAATLTRSPEVLEQCVNAVCGSLIDLTEDAKPVLGAANDAPSQSAERQAAQDGIVAFQQQWNRYVDNAGGAWTDLTGSAARKRLANILISAMKAPTADEAGVFGRWQHEDNFGSTVITRLLPEDLAAAIPYMSPNDLNDLDMRDSFWPALIATSDTALAAASKAMASGRIDPAIFEPSGEPSETVIYYHTLDDRWHKGPSKPVRINHNGLSFARLAFEAFDTDIVSLIIPGRPAVVRIDWIEARVIAGKRRVPEPIRWDRAEDFAGLDYRECRWLGANMVEFTTPEAAVILPLAARGGGPVTSAQITVAFAMLPQSMSRFAHQLPLGSKMARISGRLRDEYRARGAKGVATGAARLALRKLAGPQ